MEKNFTLRDLQYYFKEVGQAEKLTLRKSREEQVPAQTTIQNILRYSAALNILNTKTAGTIYQLAN